MDVWEYFASRERECSECSLVPDGPFQSFCAAADGSNGQRGIIWGRLNLTERAFLNVYEVVAVVGSGIRRERYSYYLVIDGDEIWGYDRDPEHDPPTHRHEGVMHKRFPAASIKFKDMARKAWETTSAHEALHPVIGSAE